MSPMLKAFIRQRQTAFESEVRTYFQATTRYRSRVRLGTIVIVDKSEEMSDFLKDLAERCGLSAKILRYDDVEAAKCLICQLGSEHVKVVVVNSELLSGQEEFVTWMNNEFTDIPVWISDCPIELDGELRSNGLRVGIVHQGVPLPFYADIVGFPVSARDMAFQNAVPA